MTNRLYLAFVCSFCLLPPATAWAAGETNEVPAALTSPATLASPAAAPAQVAPTLPSPAKAASTTETADKPTAETPSPAKPAPTAATQVNPQTAPKLPAKPVANAPPPPKPLQSQAIPQKTIPVAKPASSPAVPLKAPQQPASAVKPQPPSLAGKTTAVPESTTAPHTADIEVFLREGCLNCDKATEFLGKLHNLQPQLKINIRDVRKEPAALVLLKRMAQNQGTDTLDYPAFVVGGQLIMGFSVDANTAQQILDNLPLSHATGQQDDGGIGESCSTGKEPSCGLIPPPPESKPEKLSINLFGQEIAVAQIGLPLFTVVMGLLDGLNHGSTWVLVLMVSLLIPMKNRALMLTVAGTFIAIKGLLYFILLLVWLNLFHFIEISRLTQLVFSALAFVAAAFYFKNYLQYGQHITMSVNEISKPGIYTHIRRIVQAETLLAALMGTILLSLYVQLGELTFTSVFPALYIRILTLHHLDQLGTYAYLLLYNLAYMLDDIVVLSIALFSFRHRQMAVQKSSLLMLITALAIFGISLYLLLMRP